MKVGQVIYVVPKGKRMLQPALVIEESTTKTLTTDRLVTHGVRLHDGTVEHDLESYAQDVFLTPKDARNELTKRASEGVNKIVAQAVALATCLDQKDQKKPELVHDFTVSQETSDAHERLLHVDDNETIEIMSPDGKITKAHARVKTNVT